MNALIAHIRFDDNGKLVERCDNNITEISANIKPFSPVPELRSAHDIPDTKNVNMMIFPDTGPSICLEGIKYLN